MNIKYQFFLKKKQRPTDYNPNSLWIVTVQEWSKTSLDYAYCPLGTPNSSNVIDLDNLLVKNSKLISAFLIIN